MQTEREIKMMPLFPLCYVHITISIYQSLVWCDSCPLSRRQLRARVRTRIVICRYRGSRTPPAGAGRGARWQYLESIDSVETQWLSAARTPRPAARPVLSHERSPCPGLSCWSSCSWCPGAPSPSPWSPRCRPSASWRSPYTARAGTSVRSTQAGSTHPSSTPTISRWLHLMQKQKEHDFFCAKSHQ